MARRKGVCGGCGGPTSRTSIKTCGDCADGRIHAVLNQRTMTAHGDGTATLTATVKERIRNVDDLVRVCHIDTSQWRVVSHEVKSYEMGSKDADGNPCVTPMCAVSAKLAAKIAEQTARAEIAALFDAARAKMPALPSRPKTTPTDLMATVEVFDLHLGKLCWGKETGFGDYDSDIAERRFIEAVDSLLSRIGHAPVSRIVFPFGNDFLHADNKKGTTSNGTPLDMDSRYTRVYVKGREMLTWAIRRCLEVAPVEAVAVPGNHDRVSTFTLGDSLACLFHNTRHVKIDNQPTLGKYVEHGQCMIYYTHGDAGKLKDIPLKMATEQPEMFGRTKWREAHTGHLHGEQAVEIRGVKVRVSPALCDPDYWHAENGYTGNLLQSEAYVWHRSEGPILKAFHTA